MDRENKNNQVMDKAEALNIAYKYANTVRERYDHAEVILFGSYAKGNFNEDSDIDIAVVLKDYNNLLEIQLELMKLRRKIDSRIEPHPFRKRDFEISNPIVSEILTYGRVLSEQSEG